MRSKEKNLFNKISSVYALFFKWQMRNYKSILDKAKNDIDLSIHQKVIDVGCGTGALCSVLDEYGFEVTGIEPAEKMIEIARNKASKKIEFVQGNVLHGLPFEDKSFDMAVSSSVAHGLKARERLMMYKEMRRVSRHSVVLIDYNEKRSLIINVAEWLEGGDYFNFIKNVKDELKKQFGAIKLINTGKWSSTYICKISEE
ncbi:MAG: class I SAM-dependent methyltransferase [Eubacteriales bacterium]|nr:class I SAM-dependent methyltransferase [Eubacteriales bacterium]MDD4629756.1 class I SAM-dependent methyltransferase [Eubacteriales bacterium]